MILYESMTPPHLTSHVQMEHYGKPRAVSLIRKSQLGDLKQVRPSPNP